MTAVLSEPALAAQYAMATPFSYAQAAKTAPVNTELSLPNGASSQPNAATSSETASAPAQEVPNKNSSRDQNFRAEPASGSKLAENDGKQAPRPPTQSSENTAKSATATNEQPRQSNADGEPVQADTRPRPTAHDASMAPPDLSSSAEKSGEAKRGRRNRKTHREGRKDASKDSGKEAEDDTKAEKEPEEDPAKPIPVVELMPAPPPSVNPWHKRASLNNAPTTSRAPQEPRPSEMGVESPSAEAGPTKVDRPQPVGAQGAKTLRKSPVGAPDSTDKDEKTSMQGRLPVNHDATSWPTLPEGEDTKSGKSQQSKPQAQDGPNAGAKQKKRWEKVPLEHSNIYPSPVPSRGGGNRGRGRGGKESGGRGGSAATGSGASASTNASSKGEMKPRVQHDGNAGRAGSGGRGHNSPSGSRRNGPGDVAARKHSIASAKDLPETFATSNRVPQSRAKSEAAPVEPYHGSGQGTNKHYQSNSHAKEPSFSAKEPATNGRDREFARSDRSRGGYRGRGSHNGNSHGHSHSLSHSQANFAGPSGYGSRQGQVPFGNVNNGSGFGPGHRGGRGAGRGGQFGGRNGGPSAPPVSVHPTAVNGAQPLNGGHNTRAHPPNISVDPSTYYYPPAPYSAPPVAPPREGWIPLLTRQLEFWFSEENLVQDPYLRGNMDTGGYVLLSVIMGFSRIEQMNASLEDIRYAISQTDKVHLYGASDGQERIRVAENPTKWTFPAEHRINPTLEAVNPYRIQPQLPSSAAMGVSSPISFYDSAFYGPGFTHPEAGPLQTQFNHHTSVDAMPHSAFTPSRQLTAEAPEFAPANSAATHGGHSGGTADQNSMGSSANPEEMKSPSGGDPMEQ